MADRAGRPGRIDWRSGFLIYVVVLVVWIGTDAAMGRHAEFFNSYELLLQLAGGGHAGRPFIAGQASLGAAAWAIGLAALVLLPVLAAAMGLAALRLYEWKRARGGWFAARRGHDRRAAGGRGNSDDDTRGEAGGGTRP